ncbi:MAG TPA: FAD-dependent oxidoreductase [Candidatus Binataceae bacterium]|nr:FAD-dependent oxidoreductase [Candidatus Binataceae bacterium]
MATFEPLNLKRRFNGTLLLPGDAEYEAARRVHNGAIDRRPALVAICADADDVRRAVEFAREHQLLTAVRSGGHSQVGHSTCDGGMIIDLSGLKEIRVARERAIANVGGGVRAAELDRATQAVGLATVLGQCPSVGIGGLTTGGGFGWLTGSHGLTCDNLLSAQVVTADGAQMRAAADENDDLFWAIRGGGGNFGIAIQLEYRLHPVGQVVGGILSYPLVQAREGFAFVRGLLSRQGDALGVSFGIRPLGESSVFAIAVCFCGDANDAKPLLDELQSFACPIDGSISPLPYLQMQSLSSGSPSGTCLHNIGGFIRELSDKAIDTIIECVRSNPCASKSFWFDRYHGAMCRVAQPATAFPVREAGFGFLIEAEWNSSANGRPQVDWVNQSLKAMEPFSADITYVANLGADSPERVRSSYGPNYTRLSLIKRKYDPDNFFQLNQNIAPA